MRKALHMEILVVDDDPGALRSVVANLASMGHRVDSAESGLRALAQIASASLSKDTPEVVVTDFKMPGMDGLELIRRLRESTPGLSAILMPGYWTEKIRRKVRELTLDILQTCNGSFIISLIPTFLKGYVCFLAETRNRYMLFS